MLERKSPAAARTSLTLKGRPSNPFPVTDGPCRHWCWICQRLERGRNGRSKKSHYNIQYRQEEFPELLCIIAGSQGPVLFHRLENIDNCRPKSFYSPWLILTMARFLKLSHRKGMDKARGVDESPIVSNMIPEEKLREEDLVSQIIWRF